LAKENKRLRNAAGKRKIPEDEDAEYVDENVRSKEKKQTKPKTPTKKSKKEDADEAVLAIAVRFIEKNPKNRNYELDDVYDAVRLDKIIGFGDAIDENDVWFLSVLINFY
jgi:hypothetical protein